jgi:hypothetical protein
MPPHVNGIDPVGPPPILDRSIAVDARGPVALPPGPEIGGQVDRHVLDLPAVLSPTADRRPETKTTTTTTTTDSTSTSRRALSPELIVPVLVLVERELSPKLIVLVLVLAQVLVLVLVIVIVLILILVLVIVLVLVLVQDIEHDCGPPPAAVLAVRAPGHDGNPQRGGQDRWA